MSFIAKLIFSNTSIHYEIAKSSFIIGDLYILDIFGYYPSFILSIYSALISAGLIIVVPMLKFINKPTSIWLNLVFIINLISSIYFIFFSEYFTYSMWSFLEIYWKTEIYIWLIIPYFLIIGFIPLPAEFLTKLKYVFITLVYAIIFSCIRYIAIIYILREFSYIYMAVLFFMFGPFFDLIYIVSFYSVFVNKISKKLRKDNSKWEWLY